MSLAYQLYKDMFELGRLYKRRGTPFILRRTFNCPDNTALYKITEELKALHAGTEMWDFMVGPETHWAERERPNPAVTWSTVTMKLGADVN